jgi:hypothetical protein
MGACGQKQDGHGGGYFLVTVETKCRSGVFPKMKRAVDLFICDSSICRRPIRQDRPNLAGFGVLSNIVASEIIWIRSFQKPAGSERSQSACKDAGGPSQGKQSLQGCRRSQWLKFHDAAEAA